MNAQGHYILGSNATAYNLARIMQQMPKHTHIALIIDKNLSHQQIPETCDLEILSGDFFELLPTLNPQYTMTITLHPLPYQKLYDILQALHSHQFTHISYIPSLSYLPQLPIWQSSQDISSEYLLGRSSISFPLNEHIEYLSQKDILITGAGGSIGSELAKQLLRAHPRTIYLFGHGETSIYHTEKNLKKLQYDGLSPNTNIRPIIGELQDQPYMRYLLNKIQPHAIFHCAAHKHVPLMELNPIEAIKNNVFGVHHLVEAAKEYQPERLVLISTDKAVDPVNIYGVSKALSEEILLKASQAGYPFFIVRFGNVLGSRGSILPLFQEQILHGGPLTITDHRMQRYWMTIPEATSLVLMAGGVANPHPLYLLDMGSPIKTIHIAKQMAKLYGYDLDNGDLPLSIIGLRPGESLHEDLIAKNEEICSTDYPKLLQVSKQEELISQKDLSDILSKLQHICFFTEDYASSFRSYSELLALLKEFFPTLESNDESDWL
ncbi:polysaccharide biosynthesis protein [Entomospira entomophila]|uniref:Polysaccharide biosynthesis protein n=1 Tax=Entomospira entomophila TaxID=2719988 RepID=A0A968GBE5_9SPIO|nr:polysaccharide biosynthesis protein [Entomospira entomophilus]NIZ40286.1 polysaccharide biosynthesis protein [Entomospira entomophilus]WDI35845.1 polysaccharide biosynthesis protein [Entomospira entomophilus]